MTLYKIELGVDWNEHAERAWLKREEIARILSEDGKAKLVDVREENLLGMLYSVEAGDIGQAAIKGLDLLRRSFSEIGANLSLDSLRVTVEFSGSTSEVHRLG